MKNQTRREFLKAGTALAATPFLSSLPFQARAAEPTKRPNIIYVFADQMRVFARSGFPGSDPVHTPRLDAFAAQSMELTQAASTYPVCSPHRAMLLSGRYPHKNTVLGNVYWKPGPTLTYQLQDDQTCVTDVLAKAGYDVGYIGKWHLTRPHEPLLGAFSDKRDGSIWEEFTPPESRHGISYWYADNCYDMHLRPVYWGPGDTRENFHFVDQWSPEHETDKAISYLQGRQKEANPFALFVSHNPPHPPYNQVPEKYRKLYGDATPAELLTRKNVRSTLSNKFGRGADQATHGVRDYFACVSGVDTQFGRLLDEVDRLGLSENTLVVFTSDHGEMMGSHGLMQKNVWYDEAFRVPCLMRFPGRLAAGAKDDLLINTPDIPATLLGLAGLTGSIPAEWQGKDFSQVLGDAKASRPEGQLYWRDFDALRGIRTQRYTYVLPGKKGAQVNGPILYDNQEDPFQLTNIASDKPAVLNELTGLILDSKRSIDDPWTPLPA